MLERSRWRSSTQSTLWLSLAAVQRGIAVASSLRSLSAAMGFANRQADCPTRRPRAVRTQTWQDCRGSTPIRIVSKIATPKLRVSTCVLGRQASLRLCRLCEHQGRWRLMTSPINTRALLPCMPMQWPSSRMPCGPWGKCSCRLTSTCYSCKTLFEFSCSGSGAVAPLHCKKKACLTRGA